MPNARCLFCGTSSGKRTKEHVWKRSLRERFPAVESLTFWEQTEVNTNISTRPISQFDITVNAVCAACNAGWLNELEELALPALDFFGRAVGSVPTRTQLCDLAFWAATRALLRTHSSPAGRAPKFLFEAIYANRIERRVPGGFVVSIAQTSGADMEAGLHQSGRIEGGYLGHVSVSFGALVVSVFVAGPDSLTASLAKKASEQLNRWIPHAFWQLAPYSHPPATHRLRTLNALEAKVAGSCLGFLLDLAPRDQFGLPLDLAAVVPASEMGEVPWLIAPAQESTS